MILRKKRSNVINGYMHSRWIYFDILAYLFKPVNGVGLGVGKRVGAVGNRVG